MKKLEVKNLTSPRNGCAVANQYTVSRRVKGGYTMAYYKNYSKEYIGASDSARLLIEGINEEGVMDVKRLNFGEDGSYNAYIVDARCEIPAHYKLQFSFNDFILINDDRGRVATGEAQKINVYTAGDFGCIIQCVDSKGFKWNGSPITF